MDLNAPIKEPRSMIAVTQLTAELAGVINEMRIKFAAAVSGTVSGVEQATQSSKAGYRTSSALSAAEQSLREATDAMMTVRDEMRAAGVRADAEW